MAGAAHYARQQNFTNWQTNNPGVDFNGTDLDNEYNAILTALNSTIDNLALIQRADGQLANGSVGQAQLSGTIVTSVSPPTQWAGGIAYSVRNTVVTNNKWYWCVTAHTSGIFATDLAAGLWMQIFDFSSLAVGGQAASAGLTAFSTAAAAGAANQGIYFTAANTLATYDIQSNSPLFAVAGGSHDALTATLAPVPASFPDGMVIEVRATAANTGTTPTLAVNADGARTITTRGGQPLVANDIAGAGHVLRLSRKASGPTWELLNPRGLLDNSSAANARTSLGLGTAATGTTGTAAGNVVALDGSAKLPAVDGSQLTNLASSGIPSGVCVAHLDTVAPAGWVLASGRTIGDGSSSATERANADTSALFTLLWNAYSNTILPLQNSSGTPISRGGSAAADFAAHNRLTLPDLRGRAVFGKDDMGGSVAGRLTSGGSGILGTGLGNSGGVETVTLGASQIPAHTHGGVATGSGGYSASGGINGAGPILQIGSTGSTGGGLAHQNMPPAWISNKIIKL